MSGMKPVLWRGIHLLILLAVSAGSLPANCATDESSPAQSAGDLAQRVQELEKEVALLRSQIAGLRSRQDQDSEPPTAAVASPAGVSPTIEAANIVDAPDSPSPLARILGSTTLSGSIDVYYAHNFNHPTSRNSGLRSFDAPANQFALNLAQVVLDKPPDPSNGRLGYRFSMGFGQAMNAVNSSEARFAQYLKEAYFSYLIPAGSGLQVDVGKFVTPHGAEVIETSDNWNYSRGLLFSYAIPYYHFGIRAKYKFSDRYTVSGFVVNGWNNISDNNSGKTLGASFTWNATSKLSLTENYMVGPETAGTNAGWRHLSDTLVAYSPTTKLSLMANFDYGRGDRLPGLDRSVFWTGVAAYARYQLDARHTIAGRYEFFSDHDGFTTGTPQRLHGVTATFQRTLANRLLTRLEFRRDVSDQSVFLKGDTPVGAQSTFTAGVIYLFDTRESK